ncbi:hypothetical protein B0H14DRAFT_3453131 [Mycena olivaceomarginata]|nr:hypothetical protein B0H14DRAFT_3453131 [Mycena olivaceomarginata]
MRYHTSSPLKRFPLDDGRRRVSATPNGTKRNAPRIVFGCLHTTHVIAGPPFSGTRWDTLVLDAAGFSLFRAQHDQSMRSIGCPLCSSPIGASRDDSIQVLLLSHLKTLSAVTQTVGSMNNGRAVNDGVAAPAPL